MKKRLLAMLLALVMVMGALPMAAFAAAPTDTVDDIVEHSAYAQKDGEKVALANYNLALEAAPWDDVSLQITDVKTSGNPTNVTKVVSLTLTVKNLEAHNNSKTERGKWIGIGIPANDETGTTENDPAYYTDLGDYSTSEYETKGYAVNGANPVNGYVASGYLTSQKVTVDGTTFACRYWNLANLESGSNKGFVVKRTKDNGVSKYVIYNVTFEVEDTTTDYADDVVAANLTAVANANPPAYGHAAAYDVDYDKNNTHKITVYATALEQTLAGNPNNTTQYWVGVGLPKKANVQYAWGFGAVPGTFTANVNQPGDRFQTVEGVNYTTLYWYSDNWAEKTTGYVMVKEGHAAPVTYTVEFKVTTKGAAFTQESDVTAANLTYSDAEGATAPMYGHADTYTATYAPATQTITITATGLEKTNNGTQNAYWVGVGLKVNPTDKVAKGFGPLPTTAEELDAKLANAVALTTEQGEYKTTYWGWGTAEKAEAADKGWLAVKDNDGKVVVYTVNFDIDTKDETTTDPDTGTVTPIPGGGSNTSTSTTTNPDGSVTTTVTDKTTGTVTETTEKEDGTVEVVETKKDGTVTETVTDAEGAKTEKVTSPEKDVTITVTDKDGEELAKVEIPAEIPALDEDKKFTDVPEDNFAAEAINEMVSLGVVTGMGDGTFNRNGDMKRGDLALMLSRLSGKDTESYTLTFSDVRATKYYANGVAWAAKAGVVTGRDEDTFAPEDTITREELALMLYRYAKLLKLDTEAADNALDSFKDSDSTHSWAEEGMNWCVANGILNGRTNGNLDPRTNVTRAEVAVMLQRFIALVK